MKTVWARHFKSKYLVWMQIVGMNHSKSMAFILSWQLVNYKNKIEWFYAWKKAYFKQNEDEKRISAGREESSSHLIAWIVNAVRNETDSNR